MLSSLEGEVAFFFPTAELRRFLGTFSPASNLPLVIALQPCRKRGVTLGDRPATHLPNFTLHPLPACSLFPGKPPSATRLSLTFPRCLTLIMPLASHWATACHYFTYSNIHVRHAVRAEVGGEVVGWVGSGVKMLSYLGKRHSAVCLNSAAILTNAKEQHLYCHHLHKIKEPCASAASAASAAAGTKDGQSCRSVKV